MPDLAFDVHDLQYAVLVAKHERFRQTTDAGSAANDDERSPAASQDHFQLAW